MLSNYPIGDGKKLTIIVSPKTGWTDRVSYVYGLFTFLTAASMASFRVSFGEPIHCLTRADNPGDWVKFFQDLCYVNGTYTAVDMFETREQISEKAVLLNYYQMVPYILIFQSFFWYMPQAFWLLISNYSAFGLNSLMHLWFKKDKEDKNPVPQKDEDDGETKFDDRVKQVQKQIAFSMQVQHFPWLILYYLLTKWLYVAVAFLQLTIIIYFVGESDYLWGYTKLMQAFTSTGWLQFKAFPYTAYCDGLALEPNNVGQPNLHTIQCVLPMNMLFDKIYIVLWFVVVTIFAISLCAAVHATLMTTVPFLIHQEVGDILMLDSDSPKRKLVPVFVEKHLGLECYLFLRMIKENFSGVEAFRVADKLWEGSKCF